MDAVLMGWHREVGEEEEVEKRANAEIRYVIAKGEYKEVGP